MSHELKIIVILATIMLLFIVMLFKNKIKSFFRVSAGAAPFSFFRVVLLKLGGVKIGTKVKIGRRNWFGKGVSIGDGATIGDNNKIAYTDIGKRATVYDYCLISRAHIGSDTLLYRGVKFACRDGVEIGKNCNILQFCVFEGISKVKMGDNCEISSFCNFYTVSSIHRAITKKSRDIIDDAKLKGGSIVVGNNVWIGPLVTVYPNTSIGNYSGILSNSAINQNIGDNVLVGGVPAVKKRNILIDEDGIRLEK